MPLKPVKDMAIKTPRDDARAKAREELALHWARIDADINDALGDSLLADPTPLRSSP